MAFQWRIRHKLILGLGLVVAIVALLLAGTLKGLLSYYWTMKSIDSKLAELEKAEALKTALSELRSPEVAVDQNGDKLEEKMAQAREALDAYEAALQETLNKGLDPNGGADELILIEALREKFTALQEAVRSAKKPWASHGLPKPPLLEEAKVKDAIHLLEGTSADLRGAIRHDMTQRIADSRRHYQTALWIVLTTSIVGVLSTAGLLRFFYAWVFFPIRDLERSAGRVAQGDFEHRIDVHSGDEMEDLATAFNDMTERLRDMYHDLARQVNERSRQLVRSERLASVGFLAAGVAHEINNPLASIAFCSEGLEARLKEIAESRRKPENGTDTADWEVIAKYLRMIQEEAFRCKAITQRLLEFSRGGERRREPTDLGKLIQSVLNVVQTLPNYKGKSTAFEPAGHVVAWVNVDEIKSVVLNLVVNALDNMEEGGQITIALNHRAGMAEMVFSDTGCGMTGEVLENIFEPFFTRSRTGKGTGLGLTISHRIIVQHGGEIEANSPGVNQGSTFTVRLPLQPVESAREETPSRLAA